VNPRDLKNNIFMSNKHTLLNVIELMVRFALLRLFYETNSSIC